MTTSAFVHAARQLTALARSGVRAVTSPTTLGWRWVLVGMWLTGIAGDAYTTITMMGTGQFEEGNPTAAAGMDVLGVGGYTVLISLWCALLAVISLGRPTGLYAKAAVSGITVIGAAKVAVAVSNVLVWVTA